MYLKPFTNPEAAELILKQLAFENANPTCQALLRPVRRTGTIGDFIKTCLEASPAYIQVMVKWKGLLTGQWKGPDVLFDIGARVCLYLPSGCRPPHLNPGSAHPTYTRSKGCLHSRTQFLIDA